MFVESRSDYEKYMVLVYIHIANSTICLTSLCGSVAQVSDLDFSTIHTSSIDYLRIIRNKVNSLVTPLDVVAIDVQNNAFDRLVGGQKD